MPNSMAILNLFCSTKFTPSDQQFYCFLKLYPITLTHKMVLHILTLDNLGIENLAIFIFCYGKIQFIPAKDIKLTCRSWSFFNLII